MVIKCFSVVVLCKLKKAPIIKKNEDSINGLYCKSMIQRINNAAMESLDINLLHMRLYMKGDITTKTYKSRKNHSGPLRGEINTDSIK